MNLRHYEGDIVSTGGMRLRTDDTVLPESFRWPHARTLRHPHYESVTPSFVRVERRKTAQELDGDYYYVDCLFSGHFGHLTTEVLCRLWGWERARQRDPRAQDALPHQPGRGARTGARAAPLHGVRRPRVAPGRVGATGAAAQRGGRLADVAQQGALLRPPRHPRDLGQVDLRASRRGRAVGSRADLRLPRRAVSQRRACRNQHDVERFFADRGTTSSTPNSSRSPSRSACSQARAWWPGSAGPRCST